MFNSISYLTICYKNYDLILLQIELFKKKFGHKSYKLIVVDNTPQAFKSDYHLDLFKNSDIPIEVIEITNSIDNEFDGISHGQAIDTGLMSCTEPFVCIFDSDFFFLKDDIHEYALNKLENGYETIGCEFNDGTEASNHLVNQFPGLFNKAAYFCAFYKIETAKIDTWIITNDELNVNRSNGYIEVGWRIRKYLNESDIGVEKCLQWKAVQTTRPTTFVDETGEPIGLHIVRGSFTSVNDVKFNDIKNILKID